MHHKLYFIYRKGNELVLYRRVSKSMVGLRGQLFSSYHERNAFHEAHAHARRANCLHSPLHILNFYHPNVSMDARKSQEVSQLSFAYASVWVAQQGARLLVILERTREEHLLSA